MVQTGIEPVTCRFSGDRSTLLSYCTLINALVGSWHYNERWVAFYGIRTQPSDTSLVPVRLPRHHQHILTCEKSGQAQTFAWFRLVARPCYHELACP